MSMPSSDADWYYKRAADVGRRAWLLSSNHGLPTAYWPPGWPLALSAAFRALGHLNRSRWVCSIWRAPLLAAWLTYDLARRLYGSELGAPPRAPAPRSLSQFDPLRAARTYREVFYATLLLAGCWLLIARKGAARLVFAGFVFGVATLVKAQTLVVVPLVCLIGLLRDGQM